MEIEVMNVLAGTIMIAIAAFIGGLGNSLVLSRYIDGVARQPEAQGKLFTQAIISVALVEAVPIICVAFGILKLLNVL